MRSWIDDWLRKTGSMLLSDFHFTQFTTWWTWKLLFASLSGVTTFIQSPFSLLWLSPLVIVVRGERTRSGDWTSLLMCCWFILSFWAKNESTERRAWSSVMLISKENCEFITSSKYLWTSSSWPRIWMGAGEGRNLIVLGMELSCFDTILLRQTKWDWVYF